MNKTVQAFMSHVRDKCLPVLCVMPCRISGGKQRITKVYMECVGKRFYKVMYYYLDFILNEDNSVDYELKTSNDYTEPEEYSKKIWQSYVDLANDLKDDSSSIVYKYNRICLAVYGLQYNLKGNQATWYKQWLRAMRFLLKDYRIIRGLTFEEAVKHTIDMYTLKVDKATIKEIAGDGKEEAELY